MEKSATESTSERTSPKTRLMFHGAIGDLKQHIFAEHGLVAQENSMTLTPRLELALDYTGGGAGMITCWYPEKKDVVKIESDATLPAGHITEETRKQIIDAINSSDELPDIKEGYIRQMSSATTFLPGNRLRAVISTRSGLQSGLNMVDLNQNRDFLAKYAYYRPELVEKMLFMLKRGNVILIDPTLTLEQLAVDMVTTNFQHRLEDIGREIRGVSRNKEDGSFNLAQTKDTLVKRLYELQSVTLDDPVYNRYRQMLISAIQKTLQEFD